ncbi:MAG: MopE-related protein [Desulfuromonadales bacterium]
MKTINHVLGFMLVLLLIGVLPAAAARPDKDRHWPDRDRDGFNAQVDCNDRDETIFPGALEICGDGIDQDCNGQDLACENQPVQDGDHDGYTISQGDCNDEDSSINPGAAEVCGDGVDQNCNNVADEGCTATSPTGGHEGLTYSGPGMCVDCHSTEARDMFASTHYQWQGDPIYMTGGPAKQGKIAGAVNTYCGNITGNWNGCSGCHVGRGLLPAEVSSQEQLANIDCLVCHQKEYKRVKVDGLMVPDEANMTISMDQAVQTVHLPERANCLGCHAKAGGGDAVKRGDLALATINTADRDYDVHMATTGANLTCQSCHAVQNHRFPGKGSDLRPTDLDVPVECANCHGSRPHDNTRLNQHTATVACQTCHIPTYAKNASDTAADESTEIARSWQAGSEPPRARSIPSNTKPPTTRCAR